MKTTVRHHLRRTRTSGVVGVIRHQRGVHQKDKSELDAMKNASRSYRNKECVVCTKVYDNFDPQYCSRECFLKSRDAKENDVAVDKLNRDNSNFDNYVQENVSKRKKFVDSYDARGQPDGEVWDDGFVHITRNGRRYAFESLSWKNEQPNYTEKREQRDTRYYSDIVDNIIRRARRKTPFMDTQDLDNIGYRKYYKRANIR